MSKVINEFGVFNKEIENELNPYIQDLKGKIKTIISHENLNGEEIRQLIHELHSHLAGIEAYEVIMWGINKRKQPRNEQFKSNGI